MSVDKMIEKAKKVLDKQRELNNLIIDMKDEVRAVEQENKVLKDRIQQLERKVQKAPEAMQTMEPVNEQVRQEKQEEVPPIEASPVLPIQQETPALQVEAPAPQAKKSSPVPKPIMEFFLGKNVIVKIAAILMVLAIITFGQIAYVDWLNSLGRFILIVGIGGFFLGLGYFFEQKNIQMYAHIFYIIGLSVLVANSFLGQFEYDLYGNLAQLIMLLVLTGVPLYYFKEERAAFLDTFLIPYYLFILISPLFLFNMTVFDVGTFIGTTLLIGLVGFAIYSHVILYVKRGEPLVYIDIFSITIAITLLGLGVGVVVNTDSFSFGHVIVLLYQIYLIGLLYAINFKRLNERPFSVQIALLLMTTLGFLILGISLNGTFEDLSGYTNQTLQTLFMSVLLLPIYIYLFVKEEETTENVRNLYLIVIAFVTLLYTFIMERSYNAVTFDFINNNSTITLGMKNLILVLETTLLFVVSLYTKDKMQRKVSYSFMGTILAVYLFKFILRWDFEGFHSAIIFVPSILAALTMYVLNYFYNKKDTYDKDILTFLVILTVIPLFSAITKEWLINEYPIHLASIILWFVIVRFLSTIQVFHTPYQTKRHVAMNLLIVLFVFIGNFYYLNHDFTTFHDIFFIFYVLLANVYLVQALRELYHFMTSSPAANKEQWFIGLYILGVGIQAIFVTQYINFSFDKVILSSYYMIAAAVGILWGFRYNWLLVRKIGLFAIYFSLAKFFVYDFWANDFDLYVRFVSYFMLALVLFGISALYSYLEKTYGTEELDSN
jgi:hypothetical protein